MFRKNLVEASALGEVFSSLAAVTLKQERERVFEECTHSTSVPEKEEES